MRMTHQEVPRDRRIRRREYLLYVPDETLRPHFGHHFSVGIDKYRIEGWIQRNGVNPLYVVRERDGQPFVMSLADLPDVAFFRR